MFAFSSKYSLRQSEGIRQVPTVFDWRQAVLAQLFDSDISLRREGYFPSALIEIESRDLKSNQKKSRKERATVGGIEYDSSYE